MTRRSLFLTTLVLACTTTVDVGDNDNRSNELSKCDGPGCDARASGGRDASVGSCPLTGPAEVVMPLSVDQAQCAGLTEPSCRGCHQVLKQGCWELRPLNVPPPPPGIPPPPAACGLPGKADAGCALSGPAQSVTPVSLDQARCIGIDRAVCAGCHQPVQSGCFELKPRLVPAPPAGHEQVTIPAGCQASQPTDAGCPLSGDARVVVPLSESKAQCAGLAAAACAGCHQPVAAGCFELRPRNVPPPPPGSTAPLPSNCGI
jgi:hypothetical protein